MHPKTTTGLPTQTLFGLHLLARKSPINRRRFTSDHRLSVSPLYETLLPRKALITNKSLNDANPRSSNLPALRWRHLLDRRASSPVLEQPVRRRRALPFPALFWKRDTNGQLTVDYDFGDSEYQSCLRC